MRAPRLKLPPAQADSSARSWETFFSAAALLRSAEALDKERSAGSCGRGSEAGAAAGRAGSNRGGHLRAPRVESRWAPPAATSDPRQRARGGTCAAELSGPPRYEGGPGRIWPGPPEKSPAAVRIRRETGSARFFRRTCGPLPARPRAGAPRAVGPSAEPRDARKARRRDAYRAAISRARSGRSPLSPRGRTYRSGSRRLIAPTCRLVRHDRHRYRAFAPTTGLRLHGNCRTFGNSGLARGY